MMRGFLSGVFWGGVVGIFGLGAASQLTPMPVARIEAEASQVPKAVPPEVEPEAAAEAVEPEAAAEAEAPAVEPAVEPVVEPEAATVVEPEAEAPAPVEPAVEPEAAKPEAAAPAVEPEAEPAATATAELDPPAGSEFAKPLPDVEPTLPLADAAPAPDADGVAPLTPPSTDAASATDQPAVAPETGLEAPTPMDLPEDPAVAADVPATADPEQIALAEPEQPALPQADVAPAQAEEPAPPAKAEPEEALLKPLPEVLPVPDTPAEEPVQLEPDPALVPEGGAVIEPAGEDATLAPTPGLDGEVDGVKTGRLPRIGDAQPLPEGAAAPAAEADPSADPAVVIDGEADVPPLQKYARTFENPDAKPLFSIILIDTGGADLDRAALAALPFPVSFVLDPLAPDVAAAAKIYRNAGQEVVMVATGIPEGATASDLEVTFQAHASALPEAVAVIDTEFGAFQADRPLATQVVPILKAQGRGLISWDRGLNAADQVARREGLAAGMVFRKLDGAGENKAAVRRALDRAAFKAAQDGRVMVIGQTLPDTVAALVEWAVEGRSASVALAPVSAVLTTE
jgi:uncharacterized protein